MSDLESLLAKDQSVFPENPSVWLKDLASFLNIKFDHIKEPDPIFSDQPAGESGDLRYVESKGILNC
jgi:hypothetical protein